MLHEVLKRESFASYADLKETLKRDAARLHLPYDAHAVANAITTVEHTRRVLRPLVPR